MKGSGLVGLVKAGGNVGCEDGDAVASRESCAVVGRKRTRLASLGSGVGTWVSFSATVGGCVV